jgi:hypothetical protein
MPAVRTLGGAPLSEDALFIIVLSLSCTVAVFWEFAEFLGEQLFGLPAQLNLSETMLDLIFGVLGAAMSLAVIYKVSSSPQINQPHRR